MNTVYIVTYEVALLLWVLTYFKLVWFSRRIWLPVAALLSRGGR